MSRKYKFYNKEGLYFVSFANFSDQRLLASYTLPNAQQTEKNRAWAICLPAFMPSWSKPRDILNNSKLLNNRAMISLLLVQAFKPNAALGFI